MKQIFILAIILCAWTIPSFSTCCAESKPKYMIKFATVAPEGSTWIKRMRDVDEVLRKKSDGRLGLRIYPGGIAGDEIDVLKKIRIGQIQCAAFSGVGFGKILPMVRVLDLPFLFRNDEETDRVHKELQQFFAEQFKKKGFELLSWGEVGNVHIFSKKPVRTVGDFAGLKVWAWSGDPIAKETFAAMGVNPIPLAITDVTTGLNTGMIDTVYAPPIGALALQWQANLHYMTALPFVHSTGAILISLKYYRKLPEELAKLLKSTMAEAMDKMTTELRTQSMEAVEIIKKSGLEIIPIPEGEALKEFYDVNGKVARNLTGESYPKELLEKVYLILGRPCP